MSVFTTVTHEQLSAWLTNYTIGTLTALEGIAAGIENTNYFVTTAQGRYVLTLFEKLKAAELPFYLNLMDHLAGKGVPSARPVRNRAGAFSGELNGKPAALVSFLRGSDIAAPTAGQCASCGTLLADVHKAGRSYSASMDNPRGLRWCESVMPEIIPFVGADGVALLREEIRFQSRQHRDALPRGAIHADLFRDNVLWDDGRISGVIDFYFACTDTLLYDVAITVNDWCMAEAATSTATAQRRCSKPTVRRGRSPRPSAAHGRECCARQRCGSGCRVSTISTCRARGS